MPAAVDPEHMPPVPFAADKVIEASSLVEPGKELGASSPVEPDKALEASFPAGLDTVLAALPPGQVPQAKQARAPLLPVREEV